MMLPEWQDLAQRLADTWGRAMREGQVATWFVELQREDAGDVRSAITMLARTEDRMPSLARLLEVTRRAREQRFANMPLSVLPGQLPDGVYAIAHFDRCQPIAVRYRPWRVADLDLPEGTRLERVEGLRPLDGAGALG